MLNFFTLYPYVLHYGPMDSSKNGEPVLSYKHALPNPDEAWHEPEPEDPLSLVDQVELALAYNCEARLTTKTLIGYIHRNRNHNKLRIDTLEPEIKQVRDEATQLKDTVTGLSTRIGENENGAIQLKSTVDRHATRIGKNEEGARLLKSTVDGLSSKMEQIENAVSRIDQSVNKLSTKAAVCGYRLRWDNASSVVTYDGVEDLGSELGSLDAGTGVFTSPAAGVYQVVWSLHNKVDSGKMNYIFLYRNGRRVEESGHGSSNDAGNYQINEQGGRTMLVNLQSGDTLNLKTESGSGFTGQAWVISFCVHLVSPQ